jgi:thymidine kinase
MIGINEIENVFMQGHSYLEVICGPMFSGKTEELIRRIRRVEYARMRAIVFKPEIDTRYDKEMIVSHSEQKINSIVVNNAQRIRAYLSSCTQPFHVVGLDEVQFFDKDVVYLCEDLVSAGIRVIVAGLCQDFLGRPFGPMPELLAHADIVTKLWAVCMKCGAPASKSQRLIHPGQQKDDAQVLIGTASGYEARCRACHVRGVIELEHEQEKQAAIDFPGLGL